MKIQVEVFWVVTPCGVSEVRAAPIFTLKMEAAWASETPHGVTTQKTST
jgi:hypothetical protein